jgi:lipopolysaccharide transport system ATP-binding protein
MLGSDGTHLSALNGGETVTIRVQAHCEVDLDKPILGFSVKDRLGQHLFGDNSYLTYAGGELSVQAGQTVTAEFRMAMPLLLTGEYSICAAIASGTLENHTQHQWMHDAMVFKVHSSSLTGVLVGIPMDAVELTVEESPP